MASLTKDRCAGERSARRGITRVVWVIALGSLAGCSHSDKCADPTSPGCHDELVGVGMQPFDLILIGPGASNTIIAIPKNRDSAQVTAGATTWSVANSSIISLSASGSSATVTAVARGSTSVNATVNAAHGATQVVGNAVVRVVDVVSILVTPSQPSIPVTQSIRLTATVDADPGYGEFTWASLNPTVATVSPDGLVTGVGLGTAIIEARSTRKTSVVGRATVSVNTPISRIDFTLTPPCISPGRTSRASVTAFDQNNQPVAGRPVTFSILPPGAATLTPPSDFLGVSNGAVTITATVDGLSAQAPLTVNSLATTVGVALAKQSLDIGEHTQATATPTTCDGVSISRAAAWRSSNPAVATVDQATGAVTAVSSGSAQVIATVDGREGNAVVSVAPPTPAQTLVLSPENVSGVVLDAVGQPVRVGVNDAGGRPIPGVLVRFEVTSGGGSVARAHAAAAPLTTDVATDASGVAQATWTLGATEGAQDLDVYLPNTPAIARRTIHAIAANPIAFLEPVIATDVDQQATIFAGAYVTPAVKLLKKNRAPVVGGTVVFSVQGGGQLLPSPNAVTNAQGIAALSKWTLGPTVGTQKVTATFAQLAGVAVEFRANAGYPSLADATTPTTARNSSPYATKIRVLDHRQNPVAGVQVTLFSPSGGSSFTPGVPLSDATGIASTSWNLGPTRTPYSAQARVGAGPVLSLGVTATLPPLNKGVIQGTVVTLARNGSTTPTPGVQITIGRAAVTYTAPPSGSNGAFESPDIDGNLTYVVSVPVQIGRISEIRYGVTPPLGSFLQIGTVRITPSNTQGPIVFELVGSTADDDDTNIRVWEGTGGDGTEPGRRELSQDDLFRNGTRWNISDKEGFYLVKATSSTGAVVFKDCTFNDNLQSPSGGSAPVCTINVP